MVPVEFTTWRIQSVKFVRKEISTRLFYQYQDGSDLLREFTSGMITVENVRLGISLELYYVTVRLEKLPTFLQVDFSLSHSLTFSHLLTNSLSLSLSHSLTHTHTHTHTHEDIILFKSVIKSSRRTDSIVLRPHNVAWTLKLIQAFLIRSSQSTSDQVGSTSQNILFQLGYLIVKTYAT